MAPSDADARRLAIEELLDRDALANEMRSLRQAHVPPPITPGAPSSVSARRSLAGRARRGAHVPDSNPASPPRPS